jgi:hypothetical protein
MSTTATTTLPATVEKIIKSPHPAIPEKAQISIEGADHLYKEIRIENTFTDENGKTVGLKPGSEIEVTIEAPPEAVTEKSGPTSKDNQKGTHSPTV